MDNSELLNSIHRRIMNELLNHSNEKPGGQKLKEIVTIDQNLRKDIADLYVQLSELGDKEMAINILSDHVAIMVEMIVHFKSEK
ncbi:MAG TPA: hypothetical protein P5547_04175 [Spirochaetota bacterium]|jgi:hypothetical protein|nr:hypothetical protein [Spirochaetota bacterium]HRR60111.1 hypothetical protein [Spirochaetota bacterium]HRV15283.1 hypothetical protein [Spirochaetota bacterium]